MSEITAAVPANSPCDKCGSTTIVWRDGIWACMGSARVGYACGAIYLSGHAKRRRRGLE